jgi:hypothetical protein
MMVHRAPVGSLASIELLLVIPNLTPLSAVPLDVLNRHLKSLYDADWEDERGAIRFSADIQLAELEHAQVFHNTRIFLNTLVEEGGAAATVAGYLTRAFVGQVIDRLQLPPGYLKNHPHLSQDH